VKPLSAIPLPRPRGRNLSLLLFLALAAFAALAAEPAPPFVWIEGEDFAADSFLKKPADQWLKGMGRDLLSGGDALSWGPAVKDAPPPPRALRWDFRVPSSGKWRLWAREFYQGSGSAWRWRISSKDGPAGDWREADKDDPAYDVVALGPFRAVNWVRYAELTLPEGEARLEVEILGPSNRGKGDTFAVVFDAFLLAQGPFLPRGARKPGEAAPKTAAPAPSRSDYY
jgi:hypothetical protein